MTRAAAPRRRSLHPVAWWLWAAGLAICAMRTNNPFLLALIGVVACVVVSARRSSAPWSRSITFFLRIGILVIVDQDRDRNPLRPTRHSRACAVHRPAGATALVGGCREHRRPGDAGIHPQRVRPRVADRRDPALLRRGELTGQSLPASAFAPRSLVRNRRGGDGGAVLHPGTGAIDRHRAAGAAPARHFDHRVTRHAGCRRPGAGKRAGPLAPAGDEHGRPGLWPAHPCREDVATAGQWDDPLRLVVDGSRYLRRH